MSRYAMTSAVCTLGVLRLFTGATALVLSGIALFACTAREAEPAVPKAYTKPANTTLCGQFDYGLLAEILTHLTSASDKDSVNEAGLGCTRDDGRPASFTKVNVVVAVYDDAGGAAGIYEGDLKRYGEASNTQQLPELTKLVDRAAAIVNGAAGNWLYLVDGNMRVSINITGPNPHGETESAHVLEVEMRFAENVVARVREALLKKT